MATKLHTPDDLLRFLASIEADFPGRVFPLSAIVTMTTKPRRPRSRGATTTMQYGLLISSNLGCETRPTPEAAPAPLAQYSNADLGYV